MNRVVPFAPPRSGVDLAFEPDFSLGSALVRPSRHEVLIADQCEVVEPRVMQVLVALGQSRGETVTRDELIRRCWEGRFVSDDAINRTISKIRSIAQLDGGASFRIETRPRIGYRLFEIGATDSEGGSAHSLRTSSDYRAAPAVLGVAAERTQATSALERRPRRSVRLLLLLAGVGLIALVALAALRSSLSAKPIQVRLAGFTSLSPEVPVTLAESVREELVNAFGVDDAVILVSGHEAEETLAISGTVRRVEDRLRFSLNVSNEQTGVLLLTESVDRPMAQGGNAARQAAVSLSQVLRCGLSGVSQHPKKLPDTAMALYFQYCQELWSGTTDDNNRALHLARRVTTAAPDFSSGWSGVAATAGYTVRAQQAADSAPLRAEGRKAAAEALRLDAENSQAWAALGNLLPSPAFAQREQLYRKAISARPTDCSCELQDYGLFLASVGRWEDAIEQLRRGREMQPLGASANSSLAGALTSAGREEEARPIIEAAIDLWPERTGLRRMRLRMAFWSGRYEDGLKLLANSNTVFGVQERRVWTAALQAASSKDPARRKSAAVQVEQLISAKKVFDPLAVSALGALGEYEAALSAAERLIAGGSPSATRVLFEPSMAGAWRKRGFVRLVERLGLATYWRKSGHKPDFCNAADTPDLCRSLD